VEHIKISLWSSNVLLSAGSGVCFSSKRKVVYRSYCYSCTASISHAQYVDNDYAPTNILSVPLSWKRDALCVKDRYGLGLALMYVPYPLNSFSACLWYFSHITSPKIILLWSCPVRLPLSNYYFCKRGWTPNFHWIPCFSHACIMFCPPLFNCNNVHLKGHPEPNRF